MVSLLGVAMVVGMTCPAQGGEMRTLKSPAGVEVVFEKQGDAWRWTAYRDTVAGLTWRIDGPYFTLQPQGGQRTGDISFASLKQTASAVVLQTRLAQPAVEVRQTFAFSGDPRTVRLRTEARSLAAPIVIKRVGLLEIRVEGQKLKVVGNGNVSTPIFGDRVFAGIEQPWGFSQATGDRMWLAQDSYTKLAGDWVALPPVVFGSASSADEAAYGGDALRHAFLRYLDTVRIHPRDMHFNYNNWWTMPVPSTETDVLANIALLKRELYDRTGFFFDSYTMDMGWSDPHSVWQIDRKNYPDGFGPIRDALAKMHCRPGLWVSPSSCYPPALDNAWLEKQGYEVVPGEKDFKRACLAIGGKYQKAFKAAVLKHAKEANLGQVKFDGLWWPCDATNHPHHPGIDSYQPIGEGLADVMDALRAWDPNIALEPTCLGYYPSPWWLMDTPYLIGPYGDDSPNGRVPCPEWIESMTTGRDEAAYQGRNAFLMPSSALECFDIVIQCPGDFHNHIAMAMGRGHWFQSTYINPKYMDAGEWRFFADMCRWARANRDFLQNPTRIGGDPLARKPYGYAYGKDGRQVFFVRNPWIEEAWATLPDAGAHPAREVRMLYPRREVLCRIAKGEALPKMRLGPYELQVIEAVPTREKSTPIDRRPAAHVTWETTKPAAFEHIIYDDNPVGLGPSWTAPDGDAKEVVAYSGAGRLSSNCAGQVCILAEGDPEVATGRCEIEIDGRKVTAKVSRSQGSFTATGAPAPEHWIWFLAPMAKGAHEVTWRTVVGDKSSDPRAHLKCGVYVRGLADCAASVAPFGQGPSFPLWRDGKRAWSRTLAELSAYDPKKAPVSHEKRQVVRINGTYLDALNWVSATAGWGDVHRNRSIMGNVMTMAGRSFLRGIGTHAVSKIVYDLPAGYRRFLATVGCDQEVYSNSVVFVVEGDGKVLWRSPLMRHDGPLAEVDVPIAGVKQLTLIVEDGGDGIGADHADWANARLLR